MRHYAQHFPSQSRTLQTLHVEMNFIKQTSLSHLDMLCLPLINQMIMIN